MRRFIFRSLKLLTERLNSRFKDQFIRRRKVLIVDMQDYLTAFDQWLSLHICAAVKAGKDLAFRDRRLNCDLKLDDDGAAWDYLMLQPGAAPPPGHVWTVYRLHGVQPPTPSIAPPRPQTLRRRRALIDSLTQAVFGLGRTPTRAKASHLRLVA